VAQGNMPAVEAVADTFFLTTGPARGALEV
jgi:hypothetical protein